MAEMSFSLNKISSVEFLEQIRNVLQDALIAGEWPGYTSIREEVRVRCGRKPPHELTRQEIGAFWSELLEQKKTAKKGGRSSEMLITAMWEIALQEATKEINRIEAEKPTESALIKRNQNLQEALTRTLQRCAAQEATILRLQTS
ncbi:hypothetical protein [Herbaspirillum robiniae]|uniref:hypothetical protein n=1 Tax=Herbaspirillum robiniae TaxID=2014887 RepID=UPI00101AE48E|nr:hypothetical protein [Herbaspirillum robiniae]